MRRWVAGVVLVLFLTLSAGAQAPSTSVRLVGESKYQRDRAIVFALTGLTGEFHVKWKVRSIEGKRTPDTLAVSNGEALAVWAGEGKYEVSAIVGVPDWTQKKIAWLDLAQDFAVGPAGPDDPPPPPPPPVSDFQDFTADIIRMAASVSTKDKPAEATILAKVFREHGKLAEEKKYENPQQIFDAVNAQAMGELSINQFVRWRPLLTRLKDSFARGTSDGRLKDGDIEAYGRAYGAFATGFDQVAASKGESNAEVVQQK